MANKRLSKEKQALVLAALCEGTPINAVARMFRVGKHSVLRVIRETGEAFIDYMDANFRDLPCLRIEMDEQWQYVGAHSSRLSKDDTTERGDYWLWACIDADTKLVLSHKVGKRDWITGNTFVEEVRNRGAVQIATDNHRPYAFHIRQHFGYEGYAYGQETKIFGEPQLPDGTLARLGRNEGVRRMKTAERKAVVGSPDLESLTTSHIERAFLTVRQELKRYQRKGLGYSKDLETHKLAVALHFGVYNFVRVHKTLGTTPAVAAGVEFERWSLERVIEMTADYLRRKDDVQFEAAFADLEYVAAPETCPDLPVPKFQLVTISRNARAKRGLSELECLPNRAAKLTPPQDALSGLDSKFLSLCETLAEVLQATCNHAAP